MKNTKKYNYTQIINNITDDVVKKHLKEDLGWQDKKILKQIERFNQHKDIYDEFKYVLFNYLNTKMENCLFYYEVNEPVKILGYTAKDLCEILNEDYFKEFYDFRINAHDDDSKSTETNTKQKKDVEIFDILIELCENGEKALKKYGLKLKEMPDPKNEKDNYMIRIVYGSNKPEDVNFDEIYIYNNCGYKLIKDGNEEKKVKIFINKEQFKQILKHYHKCALEYFAKIACENNFDSQDSSLDYSIDNEIQKQIAFGCENANEEIKAEVKNLLKVITSKLIKAISETMDNYIHEIMFDILKLKPFTKFTFDYFFEKYGINDEEIMLEKTNYLINKLGEDIHCENILGITGLPYRYTFERAKWDFDDIFGDFV